MTDRGEGLVKSAEYPLLPPELAVRATQQLSLFVQNDALGNTMRNACLGLLMLIIVEGPAVAEPLYKLDGGSFGDGKYGKVAQMQAALNTALAACDSEERVAVDGVLGGQTVRAWRRLATCPTFEGTAIAADLADGTFTAEAWNAIIQKPLPTVRERAMALVLAFEATDYGDAEWNFCQNRPRYAPPVQPICYSNDQRSFITWGPHGATAGHGAEVLAILSLIDDHDAQAISSAFGAEADAVRVATGLDNQHDNSPLERFLCGVWIDPARRSAWKEGFARLGAMELVRATYDEVYDGRNFDGGKVQAFLRAWTSAGLSPTEIDLAFFIDRAVHMSISETQIRDVLTEILTETPKASPAEIRRALSSAVRPANQRKDRLGRDAAFFVDGVDLGAEEKSAWHQRGARRASDVGLSDDRAAPQFAVGPDLDWTPASSVTPDESELGACPPGVLDPSQPPNY